jgi:hypothetical protein
VPRGIVLRIIKNGEKGPLAPNDIKSVFPKAVENSDRWEVIVKRIKKRKKTNRLPLRAGS